MTYLEAVAQLKEMGVFTEKKNFNVILKKSWGTSQALIRNPVEKRYGLIKLEYDQFGDVFRQSDKPANRYNAPMTDLIDDDWVPVNGDKLFGSLSMKEVNALFS